MTRRIFNLFGPLEFLDPGALRFISPQFAIELPNAVSLGCALGYAERTLLDVVFWQERCPDRGEFRWCIGTCSNPIGCNTPSHLVDGTVTMIYTVRRSNNPSASVYMLTDVRLQKAQPVSASPFA
jgi:hypothetical protein